MKQYKIRERGNLLTVADIVLYYNKGELKYSDVFAFEDREEDL